MLSSYSALTNDTHECVVRLSSSKLCDQIITEINYIGKADYAKYWALLWGFFFHTLSICRRGDEQVKLQSHSQKMTKPKFKTILTLKKAYLSRTVSRRKTSSDCWFIKVMKVFSSMMQMAVSFNDGGTARGVPYRLLWSYQ